MAQRGQARTAAVATIVLAVVALVPFHAAPAAAAPLVVGCDQAAVRVQVTTDVVLDPTCTYTAGFDVVASGATLDCAGALVRSGGQSGIGILVHTPMDTDLANVTVTNCRVQGFLNGLRVRRDGFKGHPAGHEYDHATSNITIEGNDLTGSRGVGLYLDAFTSGVTVRANRLHDTGSSGIYLETGSRQHRIEDNDLVHDGYVENGLEGEQTTLGGQQVWYWGTGREGIAVDGSYDNVIVGNRFERNSNGGILLYKNCGENKDDPSWIPRPYAASGNTIEGNSFTDERTGVWVGSRMGENTLPMDCSEPAYVDQPGKRVVLDRADHNTIRANTFSQVTYGVRVEDDHTTVAGNTFQATSPDHHAVIIGTPYRTEVLDRPVTGTVLTGNTSTIAGNDSPYRWVHGQRSTTVSGNRALGDGVGICQGEPPPRTLFVMVIAAAAALPDGSEPPTPDLSNPTLGALATTCAGRTPGSTTTTTSTPADPGGGGSASPAAPLPGSVAYTG